jgi:hypothetical protein
MEAGRASDGLFWGVGRLFQNFGAELPHRWPQNTGPKKVVIENLLSLNLLNFIGIRHILHI